MNGPTRSEIAEHATSDAYPEPREGDRCVCDGCGDFFEFEDMTRHEDGNFYCEGCNYETAEDRADARADEMYHSMREDGEL